MNKGVKRKYQVKPQEASQAKKDADDTVEAWNDAKGWTKILIIAVVVLVIGLLGSLFKLNSANNQADQMQESLYRRTERLQSTWTKFQFVWSELGNETLTAEEIEWLSDTNDFSPPWELQWRR